MATDEELTTKLKEFLRESDLSTTTTGSVRRHLEAEFGRDLSHKKAFVREQVVLFLRNELNLNANGEDEAEQEGEREGEGGEGGSDNGEEQVEEEEEEKQGASGNTRRKKRRNELKINGEDKEEEQEASGSSGRKKIRTNLQNIKVSPVFTTAADEEITAKLKEFIRGSDLSTTTTGSVFRHLEAEFGTDLSHKKAFIREQVVLFLRTELNTSGEDEAEQEVEIEEGGGEGGSKNGNEKVEDGEEDKEEQEASGNSGRMKRRLNKSSNKEGKKRSGGGFAKLCSPSADLQEFVGETPLARIEVVKRLWAYIREKDLQDPKDRRKIICDERLKKLFNVNAIGMFQMNKALKKHIWSLENGNISYAVGTSSKSKEKGHGDQGPGTGGSEDQEAGPGAGETQVAGTGADANVDADQAYPDWAQLPPDVLYVVSRKLHDPFDYACFKAVCKPWRAATSFSEQPPFFPFLMESRLNSGAVECKFHSIQTGRTRTLHVPEIQNKMFSGQSNGFLITFGLYEVPIPIMPSSDIIIIGHYMIPAIHIPITDMTPIEMVLAGRQTIPSVSNPFNDIIRDGRHLIPTIYNPFTRAQRLLPFIDFETYAPLCLGLNCINEDDDVLVDMKGNGMGRCLGYWDGEDNRWMCTATPSGEIRAVHRGMLFCCRVGTGVTTAMDIKTGEAVMVLDPPPGVKRFYSLVEAGGVLFGVVRHRNWTFEVFQLEESRKTAFWLKVTNLKDKVLFLNGQSGFAISADDFDGSITGNCIYFASWNGLIIGRCQPGKMHKIVGSCRISHGIWIVPRIL